MRLGDNYEKTDDKRDYSVKTAVALLRKSFENGKIRELDSSVAEGCPKEEFCRTLRRLASNEGHGELTREDA